MILSRFSMMYFRAFLVAALVSAHACTLPAQTAPGKRPVPGDAEQEKSLELVREVFKEEYGTARTSAERHTLARKLLVLAEQTQGDPVSQYVLLRAAREMAVLAGEVETALEIADRIAAAYDVDVKDLRVETLLKAAENATSSTQRKAVVEHALRLTDEAVDGDDYPTASSLCEVALDAARKAKDSVLLKHVVGRKKEILQLQKVFATIEKAWAVLEEKPIDPDANLAVGRFLCLERHDWQRGVSMLALGSDTALAALARRELMEITSLAEQIQLGDDWWELALTREGREKDAILLHAGFWYRGAVDNGVSGLTRLRVQKRLKEIATIEKPAPTMPTGQTSSEKGSAESVDLLKRLKPKQVVYVGNWQSVGKAIVSPTDNSARLQFDYVLPDEYELTIVAERLTPYNPRSGPQGYGALVLGLATSGRQFIAAVDWPQRGRGDFALLALCDGKLFKDNPTLTKISTAGPVIELGKPSTIVCTVRKTSVKVTLDDKTLLDWTGDLKRLSLPQDWLVPDRRRLFIGTRVCSLAVTKLEVRPLGDE